MSSSAASLAFNMQVCGHAFPLTRQATLSLVPHAALAPPGTVPLHTPFVLLLAAMLWRVLDIACELQAVPHLTSAVQLNAMFVQ